MNLNLDYKEYKRERDTIFKKNEALIKKWRSIPWWKFWERPSFEEQKAIILSDWGIL